MKKSALIAVATIVLLACARFAEAQTPTATKVMVNEPVIKPGQPLIWIDQEPIIVRGTNVWIEWRIATKGYEFPDNGIVFDDKDKDAAGQFLKCAPSIDRQSFRCLDRNTVKRAFKYYINVQGIGGKPSLKTLTLDPWVVNDM
jgi:hypothetical protein